MLLYALWGSAPFPANLFREKDWIKKLYAKKAFAFLGGYFYWSVPTQNVFIQESIQAKNQKQYHAFDFLPEGRTICRGEQVRKARVEHWLPPVSVEGECDTHS